MYIILNCFKYNVEFQSDVSAWDRCEVDTEFWFHHLKERDSLKDLIVDSSPYNRPPRAWSRGMALLILDLGARRGWVVSTTPRPLYPWERPGWVGPRAGLDVCEKSHPHRDLIPGLSSP
jgi:hypothetical protein